MSAEAQKYRLGYFPVKSGTYLLVNKAILFSECVLLNVPSYVRFIRCYIIVPRDVMVCKSIHVFFLQNHARPSSSGEFPRRVFVFLKYSIGTLCVSQKQITKLIDKHFKPSDRTHSRYDTNNGSNNYAEPL